MHERKAAPEFLSLLSAARPSPVFMFVFNWLIAFCLMIYLWFAHFQGSRFLAWWRTRVIGIWATFGRIIGPGQHLGGATTQVGPQGFLWTNICIEQAISLLAQRVWDVTCSSLPNLLQSLSFKGVRMMWCGTVWSFWSYAALRRICFFSKWS